MFYTLLLPSSCAADVTASSDTSCSQAEYYLKVYTVLLGDFGTFEREDFNTLFAVLLIVFFSFMVVVVLLNVLIAIVSDSYEKCLVRSQCLFGRARVMLVAELVSFQNLLRMKSDSATFSIRKVLGQWRADGIWTNGLSHGSTCFFLLSLIVVIAWVIGEVVGHFIFNREGLFVASLLSVVVNVVLFACIVWFLSNGKATTTTDNIIQRMMRAVLGSSQEDGTNFGEWRGRVHYLEREMWRIASLQQSQQMEAMESCVAATELRLRILLESQMKRE